MRIRSRASHAKPLSQSLGGNLQETLEIIPWHAEIDIIIPRDKAAMTPAPSTVPESMKYIIPFSRHTRSIASRIPNSAICKRRSVFCSYCTRPLFKRASALMLHAGKNAQAMTMFRRCQNRALEPLRQHRFAAENRCARKPQAHAEPKLKPPPQDLNDARWNTRALIQVRPSKARMATRSPAPPQPPSLSPQTLKASRTRPWRAKPLAHHRKHLKTAQLRPNQAEPLWRVAHPQADHVQQATVPRSVEHGESRQTPEAKTHDSFLGQVAPHAQTQAYRSNLCHV